MPHIDFLTELHREPTPAPAQPAPSPAVEASVIKELLPRSLALEIKYYGFEDKDVYMF